MIAEVINGTNTVGVLFLPWQFDILILLSILVLISILILISKKNKYRQDINTYKGVYESLSEQKTLLEVEVAKMKAQADKVEEKNTKDMSDLNLIISDIKSENYIYLKQLNELKDKIIFSKEEKIIFLSDVAKKLFNDKTQNFVKLIDSVTLDDKEKIEFFKTYFADIIPMIKENERSLKNIVNGYLY